MPCASAVRMKYKQEVFRYLGKPLFFLKSGQSYILGFDHFCVKRQLVQGSTANPAHLVCELNILEIKPGVYELTPGLFLLDD